MGSVMNIYILLQVTAPTMVHQSAVALHLLCTTIVLYFRWKQGSKSFTINQTMDIMIEFMHTNDWNKAFRSVPQRKLMTEKSREREFRRPKHFQPSRKIDEYY